MTASATPLAQETAMTPMTAIWARVAQVTLVTFLRAQLAQVTFLLTRRLALPLRVKRSCKFVAEAF